jgi:hypothetical protein
MRALLLLVAVTAARAASPAARQLPAAPTTAHTPGGGWTKIRTVGRPHGRDEAGYYVWERQLCMIGGRFTQPIDCYDPVTMRWTQQKTETANIHHIQPVIFEQLVYIVASWHGYWPDTEHNSEHVLVYDHAKDELRNGSAIPAQFQRGAAGCAVHGQLIYGPAPGGRLSALGAWLGVSHIKIFYGACTGVQVA